MSRPTLDDLIVADYLDGYPPKERPATIADLIAALGDLPDRVVEAAANRLDAEIGGDIAPTLRKWPNLVHDVAKLVLEAALAEWGRGDESEDTDD